MALDTLVKSTSETQAVSRSPLTKCQEKGKSTTSLLSAEFQLLAFLLPVHHMKLVARARDPCASEQGVKVRSILLMLHDIFAHQCLVWKMKTWTETGGALCKSLEVEAIV